MNISPTNQFLSAGGIGFVGVVVLGWVLFDGLGTAGGLIGATSYGVGLTIALVSLRRTYPHHAIGLCNCVTIARLMMVCALIVALIDQPDRPWAVFALAAIALALDGVDGWLARREGYGSLFGARFDMEVDSLLALTLALHAYVSAGLGAYVILLGLPRYLFALAQWSMPWLNGEIPERFSRKVVCVVQLLVLILVLLPMVQSPLSDVLVCGALLALSWSFWLDIRWLRQARS